MMRRFLAFFLALVTVVSLIPAQALAKENTAPFQDVKESDWFYEAVTYVREEGIFQGVSDKEFDPMGSLTRGMFVTTLGRAMNVNAEDYAQRTLTFLDVEADAYYAPYIAWAVEQGIAKGYRETAFGPDDPLSREEMAVFTGRFFRAMDMELPEKTVLTQPRDLALVASWAKSDVLELWGCGFFRADEDGKLNPDGDALRCEAAYFFMKSDEALYEEGYKEKDPEQEQGPVIINPYRTIRFYDDTKLLDSYTTKVGEAPGYLPPTEKSGKAGFVLEGWYLDPEFTEVYYAEEPVYANMRVYAKYTAVPVEEELTLHSFARMDIGADSTFAFEGSGDLKTELTLVVKDGSPAPELRISGMEVGAVGGFLPGSSYELVLAEDSGLRFAGMPETVRTASFSIAREIVTNLKMNDDIVYIRDTEAMNYAGVDADGDGVYDETVALLENGVALSESGSTVTVADVAGLKAGTLVCFYAQISPADRVKTQLYPNDPEIYAKVKSVSGNTVTIVPLGQEGLAELYAVPEVFPMLVESPAAGGSVRLDRLDLNVYSLMAEVDYTLLNNENYDAGQKTLLQTALTNQLKKDMEPGDFLALYTDTIALDAGNVIYGKIEEVDFEAGIITYTESREDEILATGDVYITPDMDPADFLLESDIEEIEAAVQAQVEASGFGEEAAYALAEEAVRTQGFQVLAVSEEGIPQAQASLGAMGFSMLNGVQVKAHINKNKNQLHFQNGLQLVVTVKAKFAVDVADGNLVIDLAGSFTQELSLKPSINGRLTHTKILGISVPNGVNLTANLDVKSYTAIGFDILAYTCQLGSNGPISGTIGQMVDIGKELEELVERNGQPEEESETVTLKSVDQIMERYSEMIQMETDWVNLVEKKIAEANMGVYAVNLTVQVNFVIGANMSIALGSDLEYEMGKRYTFWFEVGLYKPRGGSSTMDILDESMAFQFYVLGKLELRMGAQLKLGVSLGSADLAYVCLKAEVGPYVKLKGFFLYDYSMDRRANSGSPVTQSRMMGALHVEAGIYLIVGVEASAIRGLFEASYDFCDLEFPLLETGAKTFAYKAAYDEDRDQPFYVVDDNPNDAPDVDESELGQKGEPVIVDYATCDLPQSYSALQTMDLLTGRSYPVEQSYSRFNVSLTNQYFDFDSRSGRITVSVPEEVRFMECDLVLTYRYGKMAFSTYDIQITIPLIWTNLPEYDLKNPYTASVRVGNDQDGYSTVWSKSVLIGQSFELPEDAEILKLAGASDPYLWESCNASRGDGYGSQSRSIDGGINMDTTYTFQLRRKEYTITVEGVQGSGKNTFTAKYGESFDFSALENTGKNGPTEFTKFNQVTSTYSMGGGLTLNPNQPISRRMAQALSNGAKAKAEYVDDSVTASFALVGGGYGLYDRDLNQLEEITVPSQVMRKGGTIDIYGDIMELVEENGKFLYGISPDPQEPILSNTEFVLSLGDVFEGEQNTVTFDGNAWSPNDKGIIPEAETLVTPAEPVTPSEPETSGETQEPGETEDPGEDGEPAAQSSQDPAEPPEFIRDETLVMEQKPVTAWVDSWIQPFRKASRTGYTFLDWSLEKRDPFPAGTASAAEYACGDLMLRNANGGEDVEPYTLYAMWVPNQYSVTFNLNDGGNNGKGTVLDTKTVTFDTLFGDYYEKGLPRLIRNTDTDHYDHDQYGHTFTSSIDHANKGFVGWFTEKVGGVEVTAETRVKITQDTVLYAHWRDLEEIPASALSFKADNSGNWTYDRTVDLTDKISGSYSYTSTMGYPALEYKDFKLRYFTVYDGETYEFDRVDGAGYFNVRAKRSADDYYKRFDQTYNDVNLYIEKGNRQELVDEYLVVTSYELTRMGRTVLLPEFSISKLKGTLDLETETLEYFYRTEGGGWSDDDHYLRNLLPGTTYNVCAVIWDRNYYQEASDYYPLTTKSIDYRNHTIDYPSLSESEIQYYQETSRIEIGSKSDLMAIAYMVNVVGHDFAGQLVVQTSDIGMEDSYSMAGFFPGIGKKTLDDSTGTCFAGTYDGGGYEIKNLVVKNTGAAGLFNILHNATIQNVNITGDSAFQGTSYAGGIVGRVFGQGIAGNKVTISNCNSNAALVASEVGDMVGGQSFASSVEITNCKHTGSKQSTAE